MTTNQHTVSLERVSAERGSDSLWAATNRYYHRRAREMGVSPVVAAMVILHGAAAMEAAKGLRA